MQFVFEVQMLAERIGTRAFQVGEVERSMGALVIDEQGRVFASGPVDLYLGADIHEALARMFQGIRAQQLSENGLVVRSPPPGSLPTRWNARCGTPGPQRHRVILRTLAAAPLYLPGFSRRDTAQRLLTWQHDGRVHLMVFTSPQSLHQQLSGVVDGWRLTGMAEVIRALPDPQWGVAINPNAPIGVCLNPDELGALAELIADEPVFHPATTAEALMFHGQQEGQPSAYLDALVLTTVVVRVTEMPGPDDIGRPGFPGRSTRSTVRRRVGVHLDLRLAAVVSDQVPVVRVEMMALAHAYQIRPSVSRSTRLGDRATHGRPGCRPDRMGACAGRPGTNDVKRAVVGIRVRSAARSRRGGRRGARRR
jgi:hypothetical protein